MASLTLKNIPEPLYLQLKASAQRHRRSLNSELLACLEQTLLPQRWTVEDHLASARALRQRVKPPQPLSAEAITLAKHQGRRE